MRVLVTRPEPDAAETAAALARRGHDPIVSPVLQLEVRDQGPIACEGAQAIVFTSASGPRALAGRADLPALRALPVYAVGAVTAAAARELGFSVAAITDADAAALARRVASERTPDAGAILYIAGSDRTGGFEAGMARTGLACRVVEAYRMVPAPRLVAAAGEALREGHVDAALIFSRRSAAALLAAAAADGLDEAILSLRLVIISGAAAAPLRAAAASHIVVAARPTAEAVLDALAAAP